MGTLQHGRDFMRINGALSRPGPRPVMWYVLHKRETDKYVEQRSHRTPGLPQCMALLPHQTHRTTGGAVIVMWHGGPQHVAALPAPGLPRGPWRRGRSPVEDLGWRAAGPGEREETYACGLPGPGWGPEGLRRPEHLIILRVGCYSERPRLGATRTLL